MTILCRLEGLFDATHTNHCMTHQTHIDHSCFMPYFLFSLCIALRLDLAEGIALRAGVNLDRLDNLIRVNNSSAGDQLSPHSLSAHSRMLPELSLGSTVQDTC